ncbi:hypothetical protein E2636_05925 [Paenisporosarcina antarctica]|uniref:Uncharacterized protein n=2 Tax=Paenisporosarcina antarctica TaxID=417367 RepID=A0A4P6ZWD4_9BACL|nr:hypothetical protein E2636_05925 [Paenisporosarcina antarctica]
MKRRFIILFSFLFMLTLLTGCNKVEIGPEIKVKSIMDVAQYSGISPDELIEKLGQPLRKDEWVYYNSKGEKHLATSYNYEVESYPLELIIIENAVVKMNILTLENEGNEFFIDSNKDVIALAGVIPSDHMITMIENSVMLRYSSISDAVSEIWATLEGKQVRFIRVTYNSTYIN